MPFCNKCGAELAGGSTFCAQCGSRTVAAAAPQMAAPPLPPRKAGMGVGAKIAIGLGIAIAAFVVLVVGAGLFVASRVKTIRTADGRTVVQSPWGTVASGQPSTDAARDLGLAIYPGAVGLPSQRVDHGSFHADVLHFQTPDSPDKVLAFYQAHYPGGSISARDAHSYSVVEPDGTMNVEARSSGGGTDIELQQVRR